MEYASSNSSFTDNPRGRESSYLASTGKEVSSCLSFSNGDCAAGSVHFRSTSLHSLKHAMNSIERKVNAWKKTDCKIE